MNVKDFSDRVLKLAANATLEGDVQHRTRYERPALVAQETPSNFGADDPSIATIEEPKEMASGAEKAQEDQQAPYNSQVEDDENSQTDNVNKETGSQATPHPAPDMELDHPDESNKEVDENLLDGYNHDINIDAPLLGGADEGEFLLDGSDMEGAPLLEGAYGQETFLDGAATDTHHLLGDYRSGLVDPVKNKSVSSPRMQNKMAKAKKLAVKIAEQALPKGMYGMTSPAMSNSGQAPVVDEDAEGAPKLDGPESITQTLGGGEASTFDFGPILDRARKESGESDNGHASAAEVEDSPFSNENDDAPLLKGARIASLLSKDAARIPISHRLPAPGPKMEAGPRSARKPGAGQSEAVTSPTPKPTVSGKPTHTMADLQAAAGKGPTQYPTPAGDPRALQQPKIRSMMGAEAPRPATGTASSTPGAASMTGRERAIAREKSQQNLELAKRQEYLTDTAGTPRSARRPETRAGRAMQNLKLRAGGLLHPFEPQEVKRVRKGMAPEESQAMARAERAGVDAKLYQDLKSRGLSDRDLQGLMSTRGSREALSRGGKAILSQSEGALTQKDMMDMLSGDPAKTLENVYDLKSGKGRRFAQSAASGRGEDILKTQEEAAARAPGDELIDMQKGIPKGMLTAMIMANALRPPNTGGGFDPMQMMMMQNMMRQPA